MDVQSYTTSIPTAQFANHQSSPANPFSMTYDSMKIVFGRIDADIDAVSHSYVIFVSPSAKNEIKSVEIEQTALTVSDMICKIQQVFGLNVSQLADILKISRATIYNHLAGKESESNDNYIQLYSLAKKAENIRSSFDGSLKSVLVNGKTLLKHLKSDWYNESNILEICTAINKKLESKANHNAKKENQTIATRRISTAG